MGSITYTDIRKKRIPDLLTVSIFLCAVFRIFCGNREQVVEMMAGGAVACLLFFILLFWKPGTFGGGDVKLSVANGMYLGMELFLQSFALAVFFAAVYIVIRLLQGELKKESEIAFGPFLCAGAVVARFVL